MVFRVLYNSRALNETKEKAERGRGWMAVPCLYTVANSRPTA